MGQRENHATKRYFGTKWRKFDIARNEQSPAPGRELVAHIPAGPLLVPRAVPGEMIAEDQTSVPANFEILHNPLELVEFGLLTHAGVTPGSPSAMLF